MKKLVIFDLDGTLLNTIDDITLSINLALNDMHLREVSTDEAKYLVGSGVDILSKRTIKLLTGTEDEKLVNEFKDLYQSYYTIHQKDSTKAYEGIVEMLKELRRLNIKIAVLSNKPHEDVLKVMAYYFKDINFDYILGKIDKNRIKPDIDGVLMIEEELNIKESNDILYVGDSNVDVKTALNAALVPLACLWGFRKREELIEAGATHFATIPFDIVLEATHD